MANGQIANNIITNMIWHGQKIVPPYVDTSSGIGFNGWIYELPVIPTLPIVGLNLSLPGGSAVIGNSAWAIPAITTTLGANTINDFWLSPDGTITAESQPIANYPGLPHYNDKLHIWQVSTSSVNIVLINLAANTYPTVYCPNDISGTIDTFAEIFYLYNVTIPWSAGYSAAYGDLLLTTTGNVYIVKVPGVTGGAQPTSLSPGAITDGTVTLFYYCQSSYLGMFRYAPNNGTEYYFTNGGLEKVVHKSLITGSPLGAPAGTEMSTLVKNHILGVFKHLIGERVNSGTYEFGMKMIAGGYIWLNTTVAGGTAAGSSPFSGSYTPGISTVTDGSIVWKCIYTSYASQKWFWMDTDYTFLNYRSPDSHDSYASVFATLIARYLALNPSDSAWLLGASVQPSGSGSYWTYQQVFGYIMNQNLDVQISNFLTKTFQYDINPSNGSSFTIQYLEDNCETIKGYGSQASVYTAMGDSTAAAAAAANRLYITNGVFALYNSTYNFFATNYGQDVSTWANNAEISWYPYLQAQFFAQLCDVPDINDDQFNLIRYNVSVKWSNYLDDKALDVFANNFLGYMAAKFWQDPAKAENFIEKTQRYFMSGGSVEQGYYTQGGSTNISEWAYYLATKDALIPPLTLLNIDGDNINFSDTKGDVVVYNQVKNRGTVTLNGATPVAVTYVGITSSSVINFSVKTPSSQGAYPVCVPTVGVGFSIHGTAGDMSVYNYAIL